MKATEIEKPAPIVPSGPLPWYVKARISADEMIATSQARADKARDKHRHRHDWSPYVAILLALVAAAVIIWWAGR